MWVKLSLLLDLTYGLRSTINTSLNLPDAHSGWIRSLRQPSPFSDGIEAVACRLRTITEVVDQTRPNAGRMSLTIVNRVGSRLFASNAAHKCLNLRCWSNAKISHQ